MNSSSSPRVAVMKGSSDAAAEGEAAGDEQEQGRER